MVEKNRFRNSVRSTGSLIFSRCGWTRNHWQDDSCLMWLLSHRQCIWPRLGWVHVRFSVKIVGLWVVLFQKWTVFLRHFWPTPQTKKFTFCDYVPMYLLLVSQFRLWWFLLLVSKLLSRVSFPLYVYRIFFWVLVLELPVTPRSLVCLSICFKSFTTYSFFLGIRNYLFLVFFLVCF